MSSHSDDSSSDSDHSDNSTASTDVSVNTKNERLQEKINTLTHELKKAKAKTRTDSSKGAHTSAPGVNLSLSLAKKPSVFDVNSNRNISELKLHDHLTTIKSHIVGGNKISRDALAGLFSTNAAALIVQRYEQLVEESEEQDPFNLPTETFCEKLCELFPLTQKTSYLDIIRDSEPNFDKNWYKGGLTNPIMHRYICTLWTNMGAFKNAKYLEGNAGVCEASDFPTLMEAILEIFHPDSSLSAEDAKDPILNAHFKTNRRLVDLIKSDPPVNLSALRLAIIFNSSYQDRTRLPRV
jgi:hypothetical protein